MSWFKQHSSLAQWSLPCVSHPQNDMGPHKGLKPISTTFALVFAYATKNVFLSAKQTFYSCLSSTTDAWLLVQVCMNVYR